MSSIITAPSHTKEVFDISSMPLIVRWAEEICYKLKVDAIAACGHSGLVLAGALSYATRIPVFAVRKSEERPIAASSRVSACTLNGPAKRWIWLDDFLCSGGTFRRSVKELWDARVVASPAPIAFLSYGRHRESVGTPLHGRFHTDGCELQLRRDFPVAAALPATIDEYAFLAPW